MGSGWGDLSISIADLRACAVFGGTYVLGASAEIKRLVITDTGVELELPCHPRPVKASRIIATPQHLPGHQSSSTKSVSSIARCIALLEGLPPALKRERPLDEDGPDDKAEADDTAVVIFPPESADGHVVRGFMMGEGTGSCPAGQCECQECRVVDAFALTPSRVVPEHTHC